MKKYIYPMLLTSALFTAACSNDDTISNDIPDDQKTMIEFSMSDESINSSSNMMTRAGFNGITGTNSYNENLKTQIVARISSTNGTSTRHTRTLMTADPENTQTNASFSNVKFSDEESKRYWDDAFGRNAKLSIYAIAVPNRTSATNKTTTLENKIIKGNTNVSQTNTKWQTDAEDNKVEWTVTNGTETSGTINAQTATTLEDEDLCYSNNIQAVNGSLGKNGRLVYNGTTHPTYTYQDHTNSCNHEQYKHDFYPTLTDGQMQFKLDNESVNDGPGHFDHGHMIFKHALTRITIDLEGGDGFDYTKSNSFTLESQTTGAPASVNLLNMYTYGKLNIQSGEWTDLTKSDNTYMSCGAKSTGTNFAKGNTIYTLSAQVVPGYELTDGVTNKNVLTFKIDENNYYVTEDMVYDALNTTENTKANEADGSKKVNVNNNKIKLEQGKNYRFTIKVSKTPINSLTCTLVDWTDVSGSFTATNSYITFNSLSTDVKDCQHFDLYRVLNISNTITDPTHKDFDGTPQFKTGWANTTEPVYTADKLSTEGTTPGITQKTAGTDAASKIWQTTWFFNNNKSFYHFRTVLPNTSITSNAEGDYFTMYSGPVKDWSDAADANNTLSTAIGDNNVNDYHWGAIFKPTDTGSSYTASLSYDTSNGFESHLAGPVGPTTSTLNLIEQHMMSNINVYILTPASSTGVYTDASVDLFDETKEDADKPTKVCLTNYAGSATVKMGNGLITPATTYETSSSVTAPLFTDGESGSDSDKKYYLSSKVYQFTNETGADKPYYNITNAYTYRVVPQALVVGNNKVGLTLQTPDNNMYYVVEDLSKIKVSSVSGNALKNDYAGYNSGDGKKIDSWLPGYTYNYYFILTKTGIQAITCTIVDWVNVTANKQEITLEN